MFAAKQAEVREICVDGVVLVVLVVVAEVGGEQRSGDRLRSIKAVRHGRGPGPGQMAGLLVASPSFQHPEGDGGGVGAGATAGGLCRGPGGGCLVGLGVAERMKKRRRQQVVA